MPASEWNGRFMAVGNGGWAGTISYAAMSGPLARGYAVASTNTGHYGTFDDGSFALGHPEKPIDFGYRAVHETTVKAKAIVAAFYGNAPRLAYWKGCSTGGRQALMEVQRFPSDFDGVIAGAPANNMTHLDTAYGSPKLYTKTRPGTYRPLSIRSSTWQCWRLAKNRLSDNVGGVKPFSATLLRALEQERHFALAEVLRQPWLAS